MIRGVSPFFLPSFIPLNGGISICNRYSSYTTEWNKSKLNKIFISYSHCAPSILNFDWIQFGEKVHVIKWGNDGIESVNNITVRKISVNGIPAAWLWTHLSLSYYTSRNIISHIQWPHLPLQISSWSAISQDHISPADKFLISHIPRPHLSRR